MLQKTKILQTLLLLGCFSLFLGKGALFSATETNQWVTYDKSSIGLIDNAITCIAPDDNTVWIGTQNGASNLNLQKNTATNYTTKNGLASNFINSIIEVKKEIWFGTKNGLTRFNKKKKQWITYTTKDGLAHNQINALICIKETLWIGTENGLSCFNIKNNAFNGTYTTANGLFDNRIKSLIKTGSYLLAGSVGAVVNAFNLDTHKWDIYSPKDSLYSNIVLTSESGIIWCGTNGGGIRAYNKFFELWTHYKVSDGLCDNFVQTITNDGQNLWIGTFDGLSLFNINTGKWKKFSTKDGLPDDSITSFLIDGNYIWIGTDNGLCRYNKNIPQVNINLDKSFITSTFIQPPLEINCLTFSYQKIKEIRTEYSIASFPNVWINKGITVTDSNKQNHSKIIWKMDNLPSLNDIYNIRLTVKDEKGNTNSSISTLIIDTYIPQISIDGIDTNLNIGLQTITGKYNKNNVKQITIEPENIAATLDPANQAYSALINFKEGKNTIRATLTDWLGQTATAEKIVLAKLKSTPTIMVEEITSTKKSEKTFTRLTLQETLLFDSGSAQIKQGGQIVIEKIADFLRRYPDSKINIGGHTDNVPIGPKCLYASNLKLSYARAQAVFEALMKKSGIPVEYFSIKGYGETKPISSNKTTTGQHKNRRVEIIVNPEN